MLIRDCSWTQVPNDFIDGGGAKLFGPIATTLYWCIIRKIKGWRKDKDEISYSQLREMTGMRLASIKKGLDILEKNGLIDIEKRPGRTNKIKLRFEPLPTVIGEPLPPVVETIDKRYIANSKKNSLADVEVSEKTELKKLSGCFWSSYKSKMNLPPKWGGQEVNLLKSDIRRLKEFPGLLEVLIKDFFADVVPAVAKFTETTGYTYGVFHSQIDKLLNRRKNK